MKRRNDNDGVPGVGVATHEGTAPKGNGISTTAAKTYHDRQRKPRPLSVPIVQSVNFEAASGQQLANEFRRASDFVYQRFGNPTNAAAAGRIALLEGAEAGLVFSSGMAAISTTLIALLGQGGVHVVAQTKIFAQTFVLLDETLRRFGVDTTFVDVNDEQALRNAFRPNTRVLYIESPSNPMLEVVDIGRAAAVAREHGALLVIDSTFASPVLQRPLELGADLVLHSATKFLGGHSDVMSGAVAGRASLVTAVQQMQVLLGTVLDPHASWLLLRGLKTLAIRVWQQSESALALARLLQASDAVESVAYPWLETSRFFDVARNQMSAGGGVVSFTMKGGRAAARRFVDSLRVISIATSLGGVESIVEIPSELDFSEDEIGGASSRNVPAGLIRLSVGIEDYSDLEADVRAALAAASRNPDVEPPCDFAATRHRLDPRVMPMKVNAP